MARRQRLFYDIGTFDSPTSAAHCVCVTDEDLELLREKGVSVIHNPTSNMKLGSGFAPIPKMLDMGINVALGTDGAASNNNLNMLEEMHLAAVIHNGYHRNPVIMKPEQILKMATINGGQAPRSAGHRLSGGGQKGRPHGHRFDEAHMFPFLEPHAMLTYAAQGKRRGHDHGQRPHPLRKRGSFFSLDQERSSTRPKQAVFKRHVRLLKEPTPG